MKEGRYQKIKENLIPRLEIELFEKSITDEELPFIFFFLNKLNEIQPIEELYLSKNKLKKLPKRVFKKLNSLKKLILNVNDIETLDKETFEGLEELISLGICDNQLKDLSSGIFTPLQNLKSLNLSGNKLESLPPEIFTPLQNLELLRLNGNKLESLPPGTETLTKLKDLYIHNNKSTMSLSFAVNKLKNIKIEGAYYIKSHQYKKLTADLVILLDRKSQTLPEEDADAIEIHLERNLYQGCPILVAGPVLKNYLERTKTITEAYKIYQLTNSDLYLLLPEWINFKKAFNLEKTKTIGLAALQNWLKQEEWPNNNGDYESDNWRKGIESIFKKKKFDTTKNTYIENKETYWWNIVLSGHGWYNRTIAGLSENDFKKIIQFLNKPNINVFFFYYGTCFGGGPHLVTPYQIIKNDMEEIQPLKFIVVSGATRSVVSHAIPSIFPFLFATLNKLLNFSQLDKEDQKQLGPDPINGLLRLIKTSIFEDMLTSDFPLIKFPGTQFFMSIRKDTRVLVINNVLLKKHKLFIESIIKNKMKITTKTTPIKIVEQTKAVFIYPNIIDVPIEIEGQEPPIIVSLDPGPTIHFFKEIKALNIEEKEIFHLFLKQEVTNPEYETEKGKVFIIKKLLCNNIEYENVVIDAKRNEVFYKRNNSFYKRNNSFYKKTNQQEIKIDEETFKNEISQIIDNTFLASLSTGLLKKSEIGIEKTYQSQVAWKAQPTKLIETITKNLNLTLPFISIAIAMINNYLLKNKLEIKDIKEGNINLTKNNITSETLKEIMPHLLEINKAFSIKKLDLNNNKLTNLPGKLFSNLEDLNVLSIYSNQLTKLEPETFKNLKKLKILNLYKNELKDLPKEIFSDLEGLAVLNLSENKLTKLEKGIFDNLKNLISLKINNNQLKQLPENLIETLPSLKNIYVQNAKTINSLPIEIPMSKKLSQENLDALKAKISGKEGEAYVLIEN